MALTDECPGLSAQRETNAAALTVIMRARCARGPCANVLSLAYWYVLPVTLGNKMFQSSPIYTDVRSWTGTKRSMFQKPTLLCQKNQCPCSQPDPKVLTPNSRTFRDLFYQLLHLPNLPHSSLPWQNWASNLRANNKLWPLLVHPLNT